MCFKSNSYKCSVRLLNILNTDIKMQVCSLARGNSIDSSCHYNYTLIFRSSNG